MIKPRCYFIATYWNNSAISIHFRKLAEELANRGHQVYILVGGQKYEIENHTNNPFIYIWPSMRPIKVRDAWFLLKLIRKFHPDCLIANFASQNIMLLLGWLMRVPCRITWYHTMSPAIDLDNQLPWRRLLFLRVRKRVIYKITSPSYFVPVTKMTAKDLQNVFQVPKDKCHVFYNSLADPIKEFYLSKVSKVENKVVCVGRLYHSKGQDTLIRSVACLKNIMPKLLIEFIGDGPSKEYLMRLVKELGVENICRFSGEVSHEDVLKNMAEAEVTIIPSRSDACPLVSIESLAVGTPIIASTVGGIPEIIRDGLDGFLVPPDNPDLLAEKLKTLLINSNLLNEMRQKARERFLTHFEQNLAISKQIQWLEKIVTT